MAVLFYLKGALGNWNILIRLERKINEKASGYIIQLLNLFFGGIFVNRDVSCL